MQQNTLRCFPFPPRRAIVLAWRVRRLVGIRSNQATVSSRTPPTGSSKPGLPIQSVASAEALRALVEEFADVRNEPSSRTLPLTATEGAGEDALVQLLEEVIYVVDVFSVVPVQFHLADTEDGGVVGDMEVVPASHAEMVGPSPKGVSYHNLSMTHDDGHWRCHVLIDV